ncbi:MAG: pantoate--beta-alanine ligase [Candidatus Omnitrophica bacterium]|nr:pantoate--beta-alanine ligase [Candidatus Omnitrophota bacterium]
MRVLKQARQMSLTAQALRRQARSVGFVPTMGALHDGHLSLIRAARRQTQVVVASIFVNPLQFGPGEDYERYPRDLRRDLNLAKAAGCDLMFAPHVSQIYPSGACTIVEVEGLGEQLEGASRPGHFRGVATVVATLFNLVQPTIAYVGQKDFQQAIIIQRLVKDLALPVQVRVLPTVREADGLAMSSRNAYLNTEERRQASALYQALSAAKEHLRRGERGAQRLVESMREVLDRCPLLRVDYLAVVNAKTLEPLTEARGSVALLGAVHVGTTRLIDNVLVDVS